MDIDAEAPDTPKRTPTAPLRDPLIRYSVFAALACAGVCMLFTIIYVFSYSLDSTLSFERHFDSYISPANAANLPTVLGLHNAQNRMFLQSCGMVAGIFFAFLGLALFLVGIQGTVDANGEVRDYSTNVKRLAPGGVIMLASMIFVGVSAMHPIDFVLGPSPSAVILAPTAETAPATPAPATTTPAQQPATSAPATQSQAQPAPSTPQAARVVPQSAPAASTQPPAILLAQPTSQSTTATAQTTPTAAPVKRPAPRLAAVNKKTPTPAPPTEHRFQP